MLKPTIFISYSHKDKREKDELLKHLKALEAEFDIWLDDKIQAGETWYEEINLAIEKASMAIMLISPNFLSSDWIMKEESVSLRKHQQKGLLILPIIAKDCAWANIDWISQIQVLPKDGRAVWRGGGEYADEELAKITQEISSILAKVNAREFDPEQQSTESLIEKKLKQVDYDAQEESAISDVENEVSNVSIEGQALSDAYSQIDLLGYADYVEALANFIKSPKTKKPITIGIDAAWGGGKTTLMHLLEKRLNPLKEKGKAKEHINTVWFDAWKYDQQEMLWAAMVLEIFEQVRKQFQWWQKIDLFLRLNFKRFDWAKFWLSLLKSVAIILILFSFGFGAFSILASFLEKTWAETLQWIEDYSRVLAALGLASLAYTIFRDTTGIIVSPFNLGISQYAKKPDYKEKIGFLNKFTEDFKYVITSITKSGEWPLVVFIDDLDRCSPTKAAEVIEAMNLLLDSEHCVFILGVDTAMLSRSIQAKYKEIQPFFDDGEYPSRLGLGRHFLEKIIQIDFHIPRPAPRHFSSFIDAQLGQTTEAEKNLMGKEQSEAEDLIQAKQRSGKSTKEAKEAVVKERPDLEGVINDAIEAVKEHTFENEPEVITAIKDMAPYLNYNPRRIKRFINIFRLQALITYQRGFLEKAISFDKLARWIVISMRWPDFIDFVRRNTWLAQHVKEDVLYIEQKERQINFKVGVVPLIKYPEKIQKLLLNQDLRNIITQIPGDFEDAQNYLNLTEITVTYEQKNNG